MLKVDDTKHNSTTTKINIKLLRERERERNLNKYIKINFFSKLIVVLKLSNDIRYCRELYFFSFPENRLTRMFVSVRKIEAK